MRVIAGYLLDRAGFIHATEEEPHIGERFLVPPSLNDFLKIHTKVATVIDYERQESRWALYLISTVKNPCDSDFLRSIST